MTVTPVTLPELPTSAESLAKVHPDAWQAVVQAEPVAAAVWMKAAARWGHAGAQVLMGQWLLDGRGVAHDAVQALQMFQLAAQQGHAMGMNMVGRCHEEAWGTAADAAKAAHWYRLASEKQLPEAQYNLANLHAGGRGVALDHTRAVALYAQAAQQGYAKAFGKLGRYHEDGLVLAQDRAQARALYQRAAEGGDFRGQFNLAGMLADEGRLPDALQWLHRVLAGATPRYLRQAGAALAASSHAEVQALGRQMLVKAEIPAS